MDMVLIVLGILGLGAIIISAYVFTVAARNYVSAEDLKHRNNRINSSGKPWVERKSHDRRSGRPVQFPLTVNGIIIMEDRRHTPDRRRAA